jgi:hypothetical protein
LNEFLMELSRRKYQHYHYLYIFKPQAYTSQDCVDRIVVKTRYQEVIEIIELLPVEQERKVDERFEELKNS